MPIVEGYKGVGIASSAHERQSWSLKIPNWERSKQLGLLTSHAMQLLSQPTTRRCLELTASQCPLGDLGTAAPTSNPSPAQIFQNPASGATVTQTQRIPLVSRKEKASL